MNVIWTFLVVDLGLEDPTLQPTATHIQFQHLNQLPIHQIEPVCQLSGL